MNANRNLSFLLVIAGAIGLLASSILIVERIHLLEDPTYVPMCSIGDVLDCGSVMTTSQASAFGFPNAIIGIIGFSVVLTIGMAGLAGASFQGWFWAGLQIGVIFAIVFIHWLMYQTLFNIRALCLYCMVVWAATGPLFWYVTIRNLGAFDDPEEDDVVPGLLTGSVITRYHWVVPLVWYVAVTALVVNVFWI